MLRYDPPFLHQGNMVAEAGSEEGEVVNYAHACKVKTISLFETGVAHDLSEQKVVLSRKKKN